MLFAILESIADNVTLRVQDCIPGEYDRALLDVLEEHGIDQIELGEAWDRGPDWLWYIRCSDIHRVVAMIQRPNGEIDLEG